MENIRARSVIGVVDANRFAWNGIPGNLCKWHYRTHDYRKRFSIPVEIENVTRGLLHTFDEPVIVANATMVERSRF